MVCEHSRTVCEQIGLICEQISMIFKQNSMEKKLIRTRFSRAVGSYPQAAVVQRDVARRMAGLLHTYLPPAKCRNALEVGCGTGLFTRMLLREVRPQHLMLNDICTNVQSYFTDILGADVSFCGGDAERVPFPAGQDLIASCSALQWFNDPEAFFERCRRLLSEGGYLAFSTFGKENMREVASVTGTSLPYRSLEELSASLAQHYETVYSGEDLFRMSFPSPLEVLKHLKQTGVTGIRRQAWTRAELADFCRRYAEMFTQSDATVSLTYHPIYMILKKK